MSARLRRERAIRAIAIIDALSELWPRTFVFHERGRRQLALGIHRALRVAFQPAIIAGTFTAKDIKTALRRHFTRNGYLHARLCTGAARFDLAGNVVGTVTFGEVKHARQFLSERRRKKQAARATITCRRSDAGDDSAIPNKTKGHGAASSASVAKGVLLHHEQYRTS
jgi:sRNA-binding protein